MKGSPIARGRVKTTLPASAGFGRKHDAARVKLLKLHKRILNQDWAQAVVTWLLATYLRFVRATGHWEVRGWDKVEKLAQSGKPALICFWHGRLIANIFLWPDKYPLYQLSTAHRDGKIAGKTYGRFGITPVWLDSASPMEATRKLVKLLKEGAFCAITPDGPKGPRQRMQSGALDIARMTGAVLLPISTSSTNAKVLNTWDQMQMPMPFGRGAALVGDPIEVPRKASDEELETIRKRAEDALNAQIQELDAEFGQTTPAPAPLPDTEQTGGAA